MGKHDDLEVALARHRERFPPLPSRSATLTYVVDDRAIDVTFSVSETKMLQLRSLFQGRSDSDILNELIDATMQQVGVTFK